MRFPIFTFCLLTIATVMGNPAASAQATDDFAATLTDVGGTVFVQIASAGEWIPAETGIPIAENDEIMTESDSFADILIDDGSLVRVAENTHISVSELAFNEETREVKTSIFLQVGKLLSNITAFLHKDSYYDVRTPTAVAGVRGTEFMVDATDALQTEVGVFDGRVSVGNLDKNGVLVPDSTVHVPRGKQTMVARLKRPRRPFAHTAKMTTYQKRFSRLRKKAIENKKNLTKIKLKRLSRKKSFLQNWKRRKPALPGKPKTKLPVKKLPKKPKKRPRP